MIGQIRTQILFFTALVKSFVNDAILRRPVKTPAVPPKDGPYRTPATPPEITKPLWRIWWEKKRVGLKNFLPKARKIGTWFVMIAMLATFATMVTLILYNHYKGKEAEAVVHRVWWRCNGYIEVGKETLYSKTYEGTGTEAKCPSSFPAEWIGEHSPRYTIVFSLGVHYPRGERKNEWIEIQYDCPLQHRHFLEDKYQIGSHWMARIYKSSNTKLVRRIKP